MSDKVCVNCGGIADVFYCFDCYVRLEEEKEELEQEIGNLEARICQLENDLKWMERKYE